jgi:hypothetical protein
MSAFQGFEPRLLALGCVSVATVAEPIISHIRTGWNADS